MSELDIDKEISQAHAEALGWELLSHEFGSGSPFEKHVFYLFDYHNSDVQVIGVKQSYFDEPSELEQFEADDLALGICKLLTADADDPEYENKDQYLMMAITSYAKKSEAYKQWRKKAEPNERLHYVINIYSTADPNENVVRPFTVRSDATMLAVEDAQDISLKTMAEDMLECPEWFE